MPNTRVPKRKRNLTLADLPRDILEKIHTNASKHHLNDSVSLARSFKAAAEAVPRSRPNKVTSSPEKFQIPPGTRLPGAAEVRELKQRLVFVTKLMRELQRNTLHNTYRSRLERYSAFENTLKEVFQSSRLDTIKRKHLRVEYGGALTTPLRDYRPDRDDREESIRLYINSSNDAIPFSLQLWIHEPGNDPYSRPTSPISFHSVALAITVNQWVWYVIGKTRVDSERKYEDIEPVRAHFPSSVRRIRVNQSRGVLEDWTFRGSVIETQQDMISLVRLLLLVEKTDPGVRLFYGEYGRPSQEVRDVVRRYLPGANRNMMITGNHVIHFHSSRPYTSNSNSNNNNRR